MSRISFPAVNRKVVGTVTPYLTTDWGRFEDNFPKFQKTQTQIRSSHSLNIPVAFIYTEKQKEKVSERTESADLDLIPHIYPSYHVIWTFAGFFSDQQLREGWRGSPLDRFSGKKNMFSVSSCLFTSVCAAAAFVCSRSTRVLPLWTLYTLTRHILMIRNRNQRCVETCVSVLQVQDWRVSNSLNGCSQLSAAIINACKTREHRLSQSWT